MNPLSIFKGASDIIVAAGAGAVVSNLIKATTPDDLKKIKKIAVVVGGFVISSMVADAASNYATDKIDEGVAAFKDAKKAAQPDETPVSE